MFPSRKSLLLRPLLACLLLAPALATLSAQDEAPPPDRPLQEKLDALRADFEASSSPGKVAAYNEGIAEVAKSGVLRRAKNVGDEAPGFTLRDATGKKVSLDALLEDGPVVLTWYRGGWCPYCNIALQALQERLDDIRAAGGQLVALTPELPDNALTTRENNSLEFPVLTDLNNEVARKYGIVYEMDRSVKALTRAVAGLKEFNGEEYDESELPLAATYVIDTDGTIRYAFLDADYRRRAEPDAIVEALEKL